MAYTTVTDECPFIRFSGNTLEDVVVEKSKVKLELVGTTINVVFISGGAQIISWNEAQALEYGYTPTSLYSYILGILKVQCGGGGGGIDSVQAGTNIIIDNSDPSNPIINATFSQEGKYLISGGAAWSGTGLTYDVTALTYFFNGNKISLATQVTLAVADPTNNRLDAIVVDEAGVVSVIQGTASVNPITPPIPEEQLLVQYILVEAGLASPSVSNENIYLDDPAGSWTLSTYTTGAPTGTLVFNGTTSPKEGINHIQADADQRLGARFVRATSFDAFQYTVLQVWVRFTGTNVDSNKSLNVRFENSAGVLVGNTLNLFNYGIQRNILNTWQLAVIPITAFGSLPSTVKGFRAIMIGGTVGVTRQWDMDWIHLSDTSVPNTEVPKINFYKDDNVVGSQSGLNLKAGTNIGITAVNDVINNRVEYVVDALGGGGGGQIAFTKTKAEIDALIAGDDLVAGALYEITGVHSTLYNDGTTSGTTIYLRAISTNQLEVQGIGKFYNPKYNKSIDGFGIYENKMYGTLSNVVGVFDYLNKELVTADNSATGLILADGMIQWLSGDWSVAVSITGSVSGATADVVDFVTPSYSIGDKVIWGGYSWTNVNGNVGTSTDVLNLDSEWSKNPYDTTNYNLAYDVIEYDYANDMIIRRFEKESNVDVKCSKAQYDLFVDNYGFTYHTISVQQFGNAFNTSSYKGQLNILCDNGYNESVNFSGQYQVYLTFGSNAYQFNLTFGSNAGQSFLAFGINAGQQNLTFGSNAYQFNLTFGSDAGQSNLTFGSNASQGNLNFAENTRLNFNSQTINSNIEYIHFRTKYVTVPDLSAATYIYDGNIKEVYQRPDDALKIRYYDNSDVLQIVDIDD